GGLRRAEEVELAVTGERSDGIDLALDQQRQTALALGKARFVRMAHLVVGEGNGIKGRIDIRFQIVVAIQTFEGEEAARRDRQALVAELADRAGENLRFALPRRNRV